MSMNRWAANFRTDVRQKYLRCVGWAMLFCPTWLRNQRWAERRSPTYGFLFPRAVLVVMHKLSRSHARRSSLYTTVPESSYRHGCRYPAPWMVTFESSAVFRCAGSLQTFTSMCLDSGIPARMTVSRRLLCIKARCVGWAMLFCPTWLRNQRFQRLTRGQAYSGLLRDVYNDERGVWECIRDTLRLVTLRPKYRETRCRRLGTMQCA
jgi:hypothetical protein